ncbi:hypothetical protein HGH92_02450 [Chitinophaga varians]|uniref:Outer membrane protein beta-barrel domain-containing protein n=1 Tax=Chitinophaga varians TaxID=2202339 RepID=A0A847RQQ7_9BACT|nr:hypothetical protein [Chitinophaga varians]NLR63157.1 hypothetical protein [Chitinophaga varians]
MKKIVFLLFLSWSTITATAQKKFTLSIGPSASISTLRALDAKGIGALLAGEYQFHTRFSVVAIAGYEHFSTNLYDPWAHVNVTTFNLMPVMAGMRYYPWPFLYGGVSTGIVIKGSEHVRSRLAIAPAVGYLLPAGKGKIDMGLQLMGIPQGMGISEQNVLERGGYSYLSLRVAYRW